MTWEEHCAAMKVAIEAHQQHVVESNRAYGARQAHAEHEAASNEDES